MVNRIFHFCTDVIFINGAFKQFDAAFEDRNFFYVYKEDNQSLKNIHFRKNVHVFKGNIIRDIVSQIQNDDLVFFHALSPSFYEIVNLLPRKVKIIWFCFGYELYNDSRLFDEKILFDVITFNKLKKDIKYSNFFYRKLLRPFYNVLYFIRYRQKTDLQNKLITLSRIDFLACVFVEEYLSQQRILNQKKDFFKFCYYSIDFMVNVLEKINENKFLIQIGNSATPTNNHLDVFDKLQRIKFENSTLFIPLSYGEKWYVECIKNESLKLTNHKIEFVEELIPLEAYNKKLNQVKIAIFNTRRQQAVGNILALLFYGAKIFISEQSPVYDFLKREGLIIYSYERDLTTSEILEGLSLFQINHNREKLKQLFDEEKMIKDLKVFLHKIIEAK
ncbi:MAG: TDP-N-acetylfucosamine:lipid II N-acetylfucosaminyltransferase [Flavobacterium sp.]|uniref:TDP-N-acetylfucosamine:lipid II N-acetylfucosaminyltransferase n=1 Tax=Flavobacterium sp. TaxID=239 RepID=UPI0022C97785|nr:TDP-N-acetylfucosamine:lipid II N-acetylfucosaminyltransferase [Flavobacterium sp.]MCZ8298001.1 TDP-N-acetylfucosamine:lipid II N-acetylfucosaminyltransferase [Flavobacterium sp.]